MNNTISVGHLTDLHLDGTEKSHERLSRTIDAFAAHASPLDAMVVTGDVVEVIDAPNPHAEYAFAHAEVGRLGVPTLWCAGNSDNGQSDGFGGILRLPGLTVIALDSHVPGSFAGALEDKSVAEAKCALTALPNDNPPVLLALHHPPATLGHDFVDSIRLIDADPLAELVAAHPSVIGILAGHTHAATASTFAGVPLILAQGVHSNGQLPLDIRVDGSDLIDEFAEPGYAVHLILEDRLVTYFRTVPRRDA